VCADESVIGCADVLACCVGDRVDDCVDVLMTVFTCLCVDVLMC
jgi:hypothetical protein